MMKKTREPGDEASFVWCSNRVVHLHEQTLACGTGVFSSSRRFLTACGTHTNLLNFMTFMCLAAGYY